MSAEIQAGWYRKAGDAPHIVRRVAGGGSSWITCQFDVRLGTPCDGGGPLSAEAWRHLTPIPAPGFVPG